MEKATESEMKMDFNTYIEAYWKYYLTLERRFLRTEEYVAFDEVNDRTYSVEYLSLLQIICSEIDVVAKAIALFYNSSFKANEASIKKWGYEIQKVFTDIKTQTVVFRESRHIRPWRNWDIVTEINKRGQRYYKYAEGCGSPTWWTAYNKVKHARTSIENDTINYHKANQINVLMSLAALFELNRLMMQKLQSDGYSDVEKSRLFAMKGWNDEIEESLFFDKDGHAFMHIKQPW